MTNFFIDFSGFCEIKAETEEEALEKFWELISDDKPLPDSIYVIDTIEPAKA